MALGSWRFKSSPAHEIGGRVRRRPRRLAACGRSCAGPARWTARTRARGWSRSRTGAPSSCAATARIRSRTARSAQGQPLPRRASTAPPRDAAAAPGRREGRGALRGDRLGRGARGHRRRPALGDQRHGPESVLPYYFAGTEGIIQGWIMGPRLFAAMGAGRLQTTICTAAADAALRATYGRAVGMDPEDFEYSQLVILWGANLLSTNLHQWRFVLAAQRRGAHVVAIDPLRTDTAERCDEHMAPRPGTDAALALGLMRVVLDEGAEDREWLERCSEGWPELEARLAEWPVERAAEACGVRSRASSRSGAASRIRGRPPSRRPRPAAPRRRRSGDARDPRAARPHGRLPAVGGARSGGHRGSTSAAATRAAWRCRPTSRRLPARTINMSRLGEALTQTGRPAGRRARRLRRQPGGQQSRPHARPRRTRARRPLHGRPRAAHDRHRASTPTSSCRG